MSRPRIGNRAEFAAGGVRAREGRGAAPREREPSWGGTFGETAPGRGRGRWPRPCGRNMTYARRTRGASPGPRPRASSAWAATRRPDTPACPTCRPHRRRRPPSPVARGPRGPGRLGSRGRPRRAEEAAPRRAARPRRARRRARATQVPLERAPPRPNARFCAAGMSESPCDGPREIFERAGRAPTTLALDNATGAGGRPCGAVAEPGPLPRPRAHRRRASRHRDPYPGDEGGAVESAAGLPGRSLPVPVPGASSPRGWGARRPPRGRLRPRHRLVAPPRRQAGRRGARRGPGGDARPAGGTPRRGEAALLQVRRARPRRDGRAGARRRGPVRPRRALAGGAVVAGGDLAGRAVAAGQSRGPAAAVPRERAPAGTPGRVECLAARPQDPRRPRLVGRVAARGLRARGPAVAVVLGGRGPRAHGRRRLWQGPHGLGVVRPRVPGQGGGPPLHRLRARDAPAPRARRGRTRPRARQDGPGWHARRRRAGAPSARRQRGPPAVVCIQ